MTTQHIETLITGAGQAAYENRVLWCRAARRTVRRPGPGVRVTRPCRSLGLSARTWSTRPRC
jgi:hypothetical protein